MARSFAGIRADLSAKLKETITQEKMAQMIGVPIATYRRYEKKDPREVPTGITILMADKGGITDIREFLK